MNSCPFTKSFIRCCFYMYFGTQGSQNKDETLKVLCISYTRYIYIFDNTSCIWYNELLCYPSVYQSVCLNINSPVCLFGNIMISHYTILSNKLRNLQSDLFIHDNQTLSRCLIWTRYMEAAIILLTLCEIHLPIRQYSSTIVRRIEINSWS